MTNPKITDFEHLFNSTEGTILKAMTIDFERGFFHADTPEEGRTLQSILASYHYMMVFEGNPIDGALVVGDALKLVAGL